MRPNGYFVVVDPRALEQVLPLAAASLVCRQLSRDANELLVPSAVIDYLLTLEQDAERWYDRALLEDIVRGTLRAGPTATLLAAQAWVLRFAWTHLGGWLGCDHAGWHQPDMSKRRAATPDDEQAAWQLFDMDARTLRHWWVGEDRLWLERWRTRGSRDPQTLERAGLRAAELELLAQGDEGE